MSDKRKIIWLEDRPEDYDDIRKMIAKKYDIIECEDLGLFKKKVEVHIKTSDVIAGFIIDVMIKVNDLEQLGLPDVLTRKGTDTGVKVVTEYLLNLNKIEKCTQVSKVFSDTPVLLLSSLVSLHERYYMLKDTSNIQMIIK